MKRILMAVAMGCCALALVVSAQMVIHYPNHPYTLTRAEQKEATAMSLALGGTPGWNPAAFRQLLAGANWASDRLHLSTPHPIRASDIVYKIIGPPGVSVASNPLSNDYYNPDIPRETRLRALKFGVSGVIDTTNYEFGFAGGRIYHIVRIDYPKMGRMIWLTEGYVWGPKSLQLVDKPSLINNDAQAHVLAVQWLKALDIDVAKLKWTVSQQHYRPRGATNLALLPIYYVNFGNIHWPAVNNIPASDSPQVHVKILGPNKEVQEIMVNWWVLSVCHAPLLLMPSDLAFTPHDQWIKQLERFQLIPEALGRTSNPPLKELQEPPGIETNSTSP